MDNLESKLIDFLDSFTVMETMTGTKWDYWTQVEGDKVIQFFLTRDKDEVKVTWRRGTEIIFIDAYLTSKNTIYPKLVGKSMQEWVKKNRIKDINSQHKNYPTSFKIAFGVAGIEKCEEFFNKFLMKNNEDKVV